MLRKYLQLFVCFVQLRVFSYGIRFFLKVCPDAFVRFVTPKMMKHNSTVQEHQVPEALTNFANAATSFLWERRKRNILMKIAEVGKTAPDAQLFDLDGEQSTSIAELSSRFRKLVLNFGSCT